MKINSGSRWFAVAVCMLSGGVALADLGPPRKSPPRPQVDKGSSTVPFSVVSDDRATSTRLVIPRKFVEAAMRGEKVGATGTNARSMMAGVAISLAVASFFLIAQRKRTVAIAGAVVLLAVSSFGVYQIANADVAPGPPPTPQTVFAKQRVVLEIVEDGDSIELIRPADARPSGRTRSEPPSVGAAPPG